MLTPLEVRFASEPVARGGAPQLTSNGVDTSVSRILFSARSAQSSELRT